MRGSYGGFGNALRQPTDRPGGASSASGSVTDDLEQLNALLTADDPAVSNLRPLTEQSRHVEASERGLVKVLGACALRAFSVPRALRRTMNVVPAAVLGRAVQRGSVSRAAAL